MHDMDGKDRHGRHGQTWIGMGMDNANGYSMDTHMGMDRHGQAWTWTGMDGMASTGIDFDRLRQASDSS
jgi:hypothetical protein